MEFCGILWNSVEFCGSVCWPRLSQKSSDSDLDGFCCWVAEEVIMNSHKACSMITANAQEEILP